MVLLVRVWVRLKGSGGLALVVGSVAHRQLVSVVACSQLLLTPQVGVHSLPTASLPSLVALTHHRLSLNMPVIIAPLVHLLKVQVMRITVRNCHHFHRLLLEHRLRIRAIRIICNTAMYMYNVLIYAYRAYMFMSV